MNKNNISTMHDTFSSIAIDVLDHITGGQAPNPKVEPPGSEWVSKGDGTGMVVIRHPNGTISAGTTIKGP